MTETDCISIRESGYFSKLIIDYLEQKPELKSFYNRFPTIDNFKNQILEKQSQFSVESRITLIKALENQYIDFDISEETLNNFKLLKSPNTFTITTGHQLNLFTGPIYFLYKIISTINLCKQLKEHYPDYNFVPIYWMATEDHDFEEINHFYFKSKKISWKKQSKSPVGRLKTADLKTVFEEISNEFGNGINATYLKELFEKSYLKHANLAASTRYLVNILFGKNGLVILDGDDKLLKKEFIPFVKNELQNQTAFKNINAINSQLSDYDIQVNPREINLFYIEDNLRERIVYEDNIFKINNTKLTFSTEEILEEVINYPEKFSPNVVLRPLYQEAILPNLCYIGGGGEIAYWLQLKSNFEANHIVFPVLLLRNSVVLATKKQLGKIEKLNLVWKNLFLKQSDLLETKTKELSKFKIDFSTQKDNLKKQFETLNTIAHGTDKSFVGAVKAQETKQLKGLENLEKRLLKAEKKTHQEKLNRIAEIQNQLFPDQSLQERKINFSEYYIEYGDGFIEKILSELNPLIPYFSIIEL